MSRSRAAGTSRPSLAATSFVLLFVSGEATAVVALVGYLATRTRRRAWRLGVVPAGRVALGLFVDEQHAEDVRRHQQEHE